MAIGFPTKANWAAGDVLTASAMDDLAGTVNLLNPTAKGNLISASAANTVALLAVGNNGESLVADSSTSTGLRYQGSTAAGRNFAINGMTDIWQRGTSFTIGAFSPVYTADRWQVFTGSTQTITQETTTVPTGARYALKFTSTQASGGGGITQYVETANVLPLVGKTVTFSAQVTGTTGKSPFIGIGTSTTVDAGYGASYANTNGTAVTVTAGTFSTVSVTMTIPAGTKTLALFTTAGGTLNNTEYMIWGNMQLEVGSVATGFSRAGGTIQGELAACQRYLPSIIANANTLAGWAKGTGSDEIFIQFPVTARVAPTGITVSAMSNFLLFNQSITTGTPTAISFDFGGTQSAALAVTHTAGSPTTVLGQPVGLQFSGGSASILFTGCEL